MLTPEQRKIRDAISGTIHTSAEVAEFPRVIGEHAGVFVVQTAEDRGRLFDVACNTVFPEGSLQPLLARAPYEPFEDQDGSILALFHDSLV